MRICVIVPTLNEKNNVSKLVYKIRKTKIRLDILFIDDDSIDGTQIEIKLLKKRFKNIKYIFRKKKSGIGSAHKEGIKFCYKNNYDLIATMDCDGTHDPRYFKELFEKSKLYDYVITSRFKKNGLIKDWPIVRKIITYSRHLLIKIFLGMSLDASGAYRSFYRKKIKLKDLLSAKNDDYAYFWEITYNLLKKRYSIFEVPVKLEFRKLGKSKMKLRHIIYSLFYLLKIAMLRFK
jgi:dolichol-phosphate mannosyltransferase